MILSKAMLDARRFAQDELDALFAAVLINDKVDAQIELPRRITLDHDEALLADGFRLSRQLWLDGVDLGELRRLLGSLSAAADLDAGDRIRFKHIRAKLKQFRFAYALFGIGHKYPLLTDGLTTALGHVQDAFKTGQCARVRTKAMTARLFLAPGLRQLLRREHDQLALTSSARLRGYVGREIGTLARLAARHTVTGSEFHAARKIASRQVSFHTTMMSVRFSEEHHRMSRALAAINGLMGSMHDKLIERQVAGLQEYSCERFPFPTEIRGRIDTLIERYRASGC